MSVRQLLQYFMSILVLTTTAVVNMPTLQEEVTHKAEEFVALVALGSIGLALVRQFLKPLEELVQRALLAAIAVGLVYGFATYGPKAVAVYEILNDETTRLEKAVR